MGKGWLWLILAVSVYSERLVEVNQQAPGATCSLGEVFTLRMPVDPYSGFLWFFRPLDGRKITLLNGVTGTFVKGAEPKSGFQDFKLACPAVGRAGSLVNVRLELRALWREEALRLLTIPLTLTS